MSNYLLKIENELTRRGASLRLTPMDWNLAQTWWDCGIPLHVVLGAMNEAFDRHVAVQQPRPIKSLSYFTDAVEERYTEWKATQIGKSPDAPIFRKTDFEENKMNSSTAASSQNAEIIDGIISRLMQERFERRNITLPEPLGAAVVKLRGELLALLDDVTLKQISTDETERRLSALKSAFEVHLIVSVSEEERKRIITETQAEYGKFQLMPEIAHKTLIRKLYEKFELPELSLFAF